MKDGGGRNRSGEGKREESVFVQEIEFYLWPSLSFSFHCQKERSILRPFQTTQERTLHKTEDMSHGTKVS